MTGTHMYRVQFIVRLLTSRIILVEVTLQQFEDDNDDIQILL